MTKSIVLRLIFLLAASYGCTHNESKTTNVLEYVDPMIGTDGHGHTYPGASLPFAMVQVGPSNYSQGWDWCSGYHYTDTVLQGFAHTHLSGTGLSGLGDVLIMPTTGKLKLLPGTDEEPDSGYSSRWTHQRESAAPGYYQVHLDDYNIDVEITSTKRTGFHRYTVNTEGEHNIIIDPTHRIDEELLASEVEIISDTEMRGFKNSKGSGGNRKVYFYAKFSKPFSASGVAKDGIVVEGKKLSSKVSNAFARYQCMPGEQIEVKISLSFVSYEGAYNNYLAEAANKNFDTALAEARDTWRKHLSKVEIEDNNTTNKRIFYTALYHSLLVPNLISDADGKYIVEGKGYQGKSNQYSTYSTWDTFRAQNPLLTILEPGYTSEIVNSLISRQTVAKVGLPIWELSGHDNGCMPSYTPVSVIVDAVRKGIPNIDAEKAYEAVQATSMMDEKHSAFVSEPVVPWIKTLNYVPAHVWESCAQTIEYAYQDWCIYRLAKDLNKADTTYYLNRSRSYLNLFNEELGYIVPKDSLGNWVPVDLSNWESIRPHYIAGNIWGYTTFVPHEINKIIELKGGATKFCLWLDEILNDTTELAGEAHVDINGFIGRYGHGDEPSHHMAYLYNYAGQPWKTQELVRRISETFYTDKPDGLINNEDCGQMSSWFIMSALGFYSFCPGDNQYTLTSPLFKKAVLHLDNEEQVHITAQDRSSKNVYINSLMINGQAVNHPKITHQMLVGGAQLNFELSETSNQSWGINKSSRMVKKDNCITSKIICGYQGWFNTPEDGEERGWYHYTRAGKFEPGYCSIDMWPDMTEYKKPYPTTFRHKNGTVANVFSSGDQSTTELHFRWMNEYGIDGVFMQRFVGEIKSESGKKHFNKVLAQAFDASIKHERLIGVMYDMSGMQTGDQKVVMDDWKFLSRKYRIKYGHPNYLTYRDKPLIALWGAGFSDGRKYTLHDIAELISFFKKNGCSILLGVPTYWRTFGNDCIKDTYLHEVFKMADIIQPWAVGRFNDLLGANKYAEVLKNDKHWCDKNNLGYMPVTFPGFSWYNMHNGERKLNQIPRLKGNFLWQQLKNAQKIGAEMIYVAMFDEMDEGTCIFKCTNNPPVGKSRFCDYEGLPSDYYLKLVGKATRDFKESKELSEKP